MKRNNTVTLYYTEDIPSDCETDANARFELAIAAIRERQTRYHVPASWRVVSDNGEQLRIAYTHKRSNRT